jgi:hypothetical protein
VSSKKLTPGCCHYSGHFLETWDSLAFTGAPDARELETNRTLIITILFLFLARPPLRTLDHIQDSKGLEAALKS